METAVLVPRDGSAHEPSRGTLTFWLRGVRWVAGLEPTGCRSGPLRAPQEETGTCRQHLPHPFRRWSRAAVCHGGRTRRPRRRQGERAQEPEHRLEECGLRGVSIRKGEL